MTLLNTMESRPAFRPIYEVSTLRMLLNVVTLSFNAVCVAYPDTFGISPLNRDVLSFRFVFVAKLLTSAMLSFAEYLTPL